MNHGKKTFLLALASAVVLSGCSGSGQQMTAYDAQYLDYFDTVTSITIYAKNEAEFEQYKSLAEDTMKKYHELFDIYDNYDGVSNIKTINDNAGIAPVTVDPELISLLEFSRQEYEKTGGRVNVAMGSVLSIWHEYREAGLKDPSRAQIPDMQKLQQAAQHTDLEQVQIDPQASTVYLPDQEMSQNPDTSAAQSYLKVVNLNDSCLVTSGTYQRYYEVDGVRYHHIINPDTLMPWNKYDSVSILCGDSALADALSTAVFNMDPEEGRAFIEAQDGVEALWVFPDGTEMESSGFGAYVSQ